MLEIVKKDKVSDKDVSQAKIAIESIVAMQPIYEKLKQYDPKRKFDPADEISLDVLNERTGYYTPLTWTCEKGHTAIVQSLLEHKVDPNQAEAQKGATPLMQACFGGHTSTAQFLLEHKANPNQANLKTGDTPLMGAAYAGDRALARTLIEEYNTKLEIQNNKGNTAVDVAVGNKKIETVSLLLKQGALVQNPQKLFHFLAKEKKPNTGELLCDQRNNDVFIALESLYKQLDALVANGFEKNIKNLHNEVKIYLEKLRKLNETYRTKFITEVEGATERTIPSPLLRMFADYDEPLQDPRMRFFKPE